MVSYTYRVNNSSSPEKYSDWQSKTVTFFLDVTNPR